MKGARCRMIEVPPVRLLRSELLLLTWADIPLKGEKFGLFADFPFVSLVKSFVSLFGKKMIRVNLRNLRNSKKPVGDYSVKEKISR